MNAASLNIVVVSNKPLNKIKTFETLNCPYRYRLIVCGAAGFGNARNVAAKVFGGSGLMVQFNDDLVLSSKIWDWLCGLERGEFAFQCVDGRACSRVFAIWLEDYWRVGGFDSSLKYYFEDGDFYQRAIDAGLRFRRVPNSLARHIPHVHALYNPKMCQMAKIDNEVARVFVTHKRHAFDRFNRFFVPFRDYRVVVQHLVLRSVFLVYWIWIGSLKSVFQQANGPKKHR